MKFAYYLHWENGTNTSQYFHSSTFNGILHSQLVCINTAFTAVKNSNDVNSFNQLEKNHPYNLHNNSILLSTDLHIFVKKCRECRTGFLLDIHLH